MKVRKRTKPKKAPGLLKRGIRKPLRGKAAWMEAFPLLFPTAAKHYDETML